MKPTPRKKPAKRPRLARSKAGPAQRGKPSPSDAKATEEARLLARWKRPVKRLLKALDPEILRFVNDLFRLGFGPDQLPGEPAWARAAAQRFVGVSPEIVAETKAKLAAPGLGEGERGINAQMEQTPDVWGLMMGLSLRVVTDLANDFERPEDRKTLAKVIETQRRLNELEARKAAAKGVSTEAEFLEHYGQGLATEAEAELQAADSYRDLCGIVVLHRDEIAKLASPTAFRDFVLSKLPRNRVGSDKRMEHFCRLIDLRFRRPGRPKGAKAKAD